MNKILDAMRLIDHFWLALHGLVLDVDYVLSASRPRKPLTIKGTLKVEPTLIPGADHALNRVLKKYGGWSSVMTASFKPSEAFYHDLQAIGYDRDRFDRSRAYVVDPAAYLERAMNKLGDQRKT
jgi:hypothetical protein